MSERRKQLRAAKRAARKAHERAQATMAVPGVSKPRTAGNLAELERLKLQLQTREPEVLALAGAEPDPAIYILLPDEDDRAAFRAQARVAELERQPDAAARLRALADHDCSMFVFDRRELLASLRQIWPSHCVEMLVSPPAGAVPIAYDGTGPGHGSMLMVPGGRMARGGVA